MDRDEGLRRTGKEKRRFGREKVGFMGETASFLGTPRLEWLSTTRRQKLGMCFEEGQAENKISQRQEKFKPVWYKKIYHKRPNILKNEIKIMWLWLG